MTSQRNQKTRATRTTEHSTMRTERALDMPGSTTTDQRASDGRGDSQTRPASRTRQGKRRRRVAVALLVGLLAPLVMALFGPLSSASADDEEKYAFYKLSSDLSSYFSDANSPDGLITGQANRLGEGWEEMLARPGDAGSFIGYADSDSSSGLDWIVSRISGSSQSRSYESFQASDGSGEATNAYEGLQTYVYYGAALNELGLDSTEPPGGGATGFVKVIAGGLVFGGYLIAAGVPFLFGLVIDFLQWFNPFRWFYTAVSAYAPTWAEGMTGGQGVPGWAQGISTFIGQWYGFLNTLAWTVILPMFVAFFVLGLVMWTKADARGSALKRLAIRFVFILVGVPLIGSMYTGVLNKMEDSLSGRGSPGATQLVLSTYVDFDKWMLNNRLAIPESAEYAIAWNSDKAGPTSASQMQVRRTALAINLASSPAKFKDIQPIGMSSSATDAWAVSSVPSGNQAAVTEADEGGPFTGVLSMLARYMRSDNVSPADFESAAKSELSQNAVAEETKRTWFEIDINSKTKKSEAVGNPVIALPTGESGLNSDNQGNKNGPVQRFYSRTNARCGTAIATEDGKPMHCNLSPLAAYNYLSTSFGPDSLTLYSSKKSTSGFTTETHSAVTQVGSGASKLIYWVNVLVILWSLVVVGIAYSLGMLFMSLKRSFEAITAIPFAMVGSVAGIAKVLIYSIALILEVLITLFLYQFISAILVSLPTIVEGPVAALTSGSGALSSGVLGVVGAYLVYFLTFVSTLIVLGFTVVALRLRKQVLSSLNESVTKMIDKFMDAGIGAPGGGGMMPALAGGVGTGVGMAAASRMVSPGASKGPAGAGGSGGTGSAGSSTGTGGAGSGGTGGSSADGSASGDGSTPGGSSALGTAPSHTDSGTKVADGGAQDSARGVEADKTMAEKVGKQGKLTRLSAAARTPAGQAAMLGAAGAALSGKGAKGVVGAAVGTGGSVAAAKAARKRLDKSTAAKKVASSSQPAPTAAPKAQAKPKPTKKAAPASPSVKPSKGAGTATQQSNEATKRAVVTGAIKGAPGGSAGVAASVGREVVTQKAGSAVAEKAQNASTKQGSDAPRDSTKPE